MEKNDIFQRFVPHGHFYSPLANEEDENAYISHYPKDVDDSINLNIKNQKKLCKQLKEFYCADLFAQTKEELSEIGNTRFYYANKFFSYGDAATLSMFIRKFRPKKIMEVGCGFSSAMILDTIDMFFEKKDIELTFIEPEPQRRLLKLVDKKSINLVESNLQDVEPSMIYENLSEGDLLFVDSSHVFKYNSDVMLLFNEILPKLKKGVYVHFHDIVYPFSYPKGWIKEGRFWNEAFFLKQFLAYNDTWEITFWPSMLYSKKIIQNYFPIFDKGVGGSIYLRRIK